MAEGQGQITVTKEAPPQRRPPLDRATGSTLQTKPTPSFGNMDKAQSFIDTSTSRSDAATNTDEKDLSPSHWEDRQEQEQKRKQRHQRRQRQRQRTDRDPARGSSCEQPPGSIHRARKRNGPAPTADAIARSSAALSAFWLGSWSYVDPPPSREGDLRDDDDNEEGPSPTLVRISDSEIAAGGRDPSLLRRRTACFCRVNGLIATNFALWLDRRRESRSAFVKVARWVRLSFGGAKMRELLGEGWPVIVGHVRRRKDAREAADGEAGAGAGRGTVFVTNLATIAEEDPSGRPETGATPTDNPPAARRFEGRTGAIEGAAAGMDGDRYLSWLSKVDAYLNARAAEQGAPPQRVLVVSSVVGREREAGGCLAPGSRSGTSAGGGPTRRGRRGLRWCARSSRGSLTSAARMSQS